MKIVDPLVHVSPVKRSISKHGHFVEHQLEHYLCSASSDNTLTFFDMGKGKGVLASCNKSNRWHIFPNGVLAPPGERWKLLEKVLKFLLLRRKAKKAVLEVDARFNREIRDHLLESKQLKALDTNYILYWPVFHMELFDHKMKGRKW